MAERGADASKSLFGVEALSWVEAGITIILGLFLYVLQANELGQLTWIVGGLLVVNREIGRRNIREDVRIYKADVEQRISEYRGLAEIVDISSGLTQPELRSLVDLYFRITEAEFDRVKHSIVREARSALGLMAHQKRSPSLLRGEYYNWLLPMIARAASGSQIWAVSMVLDCEFDDSPEEAEWLRLHLQAMNRGVLVDRVFVVRDEVEKVAAIPAVAAQIRAGKDHIRYVMRQRLREVDPQLLARLGDGIVAFDQTAVMVDEHSQDGTARGYVDMNDTEIMRWRADFEGLSRLSSPFPAATSAGLAIVRPHGQRSRHA